MEEGSEQDNELKLTTPEQAYTAVKGAAKDALNNKVASVSVFLQLDGQHKLSDEALKFSLDQQSPELEGKDVEKLIPDLTERIRKSQLNANDMERVLRSMESIKTVWGNLQTLAGNNPGRKRPPLKQTSVGIFFDLYYSPPEKKPQKEI